MTETFQSVTSCFGIRQLLGKDSLPGAVSNVAAVAFPCCLPGGRSVLWASRSKLCLSGTGELLPRRSGDRSQAAWGQAPVFMEVVFLGFRCNHTRGRTQVCPLSLNLERQPISNR